ncbi:LysR family transcriptional regulator [Kitasatospora sp. NRRL B-11411]|uniref:LysR family transcriptional regulator n=1 Tax=Kitasatospora sp. NRRL B-11411 TaxID=1463822 RepID=UPI0004C3B895|nr:LysR family transcriptional regulator [Kitasatospora sp. NRRL B-11411]
MNLSTLDLNLVPALRALLEERNVTRAGARVGLSQPAMSAALARLRKHFGDQLLTRSGNSYTLTPLGAALLTMTGPACDLLERVFTCQASFDPATAEREFTLLSSDYAAAVFGTGLARALHAEAPGIRLRFQQVGPTLVDSITDFLGAADGLLLPHGVITGYPFLDLYTDRWVCLVADDHPEVADTLSLDDLSRLPWAVYQRTHDTPATRQLALLGVEPRVEVSVGTFQLLPAMVAGTRRIALIQERLATLLVPHGGVRTLPCPFDPVPLTEALWWHPAHAQDAAHQWLRGTAARVGAGLQQPGRQLPDA